MWNKSGSQNATVCLNPCVTLVLCPLFLMGICLGTPETQEAFLDAQMIYDGWEANYGNIKSMKFRLSEGLVHAEGAGVNNKKYVRCSHWEKIEDGKRVYVRHTTSQAGFEDEDKVVVMSFDGSVGKTYMPGRKEGVIYRGLRGAVPEFSNPMRRYMMAGRMQLGSFAINPSIGKDDPLRKLIEKLKEEFPEGVPTFTFDFMMGRQLGQVKVLPDLESVAGQLCHVVEIGDCQNGTGQRYWVAHEKNMLPMRFVSYRKGGSYTKIEVLDVASAKTDVGEIWYPCVAIRGLNGASQGLRYELRVDEFMPHIKVSSTFFDIDFPDGTRVVDQIANVYYTKGGDPHILEPKLGEETGIQPADTAVVEGNLRDEPEPQTREKPSEPHPNDVNNSGVLGSRGDTDKEQGTRNGLIGLILSLPIVAVVVAALLLWFGFRGKKSTGKETNT
ncbi:hypothetical protein ES707_20639 [subsurface metagenome]